MLNRKLPWSLIGVSPSAREEARRAAKEAGVPIGEWLAETIRQISAEELEGRSRRQARPPSGPTEASGSAADASASATGDAQNRLAGANSDTETADEVARRMDEVERRLSDRIEPLTAALERLTERLDEVDGRLRRIETGPDD